MADGILNRLPDIQSLLERSGAAEGQLEGLMGAFASFEPGNPSSPVAPVGSVLVNLDAKLDIDTTGLSTDLSATIDVIKNALPPGTLEYVEAIERVNRAVGTGPEVKAAYDNLNRVLVETAFGIPTNTYDQGLIVAGKNLSGFTLDMDNMLIARTIAVRR